MQQTPSPPFSPQLNKSNSKPILALNFNPANLPTAPSLVPPPVQQRQDDPQYVSDMQSPLSVPPLGFIPPIPVMPITTDAFARSPGQLRSRYVLPQTLVQTDPVALPSPPVSQPLTFPSTTAPHVPTAPTFSSVTVLPTPSFYNVASNPESEQLSNATADVPKAVYRPVPAHWFYATHSVSHGKIWWPFDRNDSSGLEAAATTHNLLTVTDNVAVNPAVPVRGGRYDVFLRDRVCKPVYWQAEEAEVGEVRRVTWLFRPQNEQRVLPFSEDVCTTLEERYRQTIRDNSWGDKFSISSSPSNDQVHEADIFIFHDEQSLMQYRSRPYINEPRGGAGGSGGGSESPSAAFSECCCLHRGLREDLASQLPPGDNRPIKHVVFVVHGIGSIYNMRGEGLVECVNDMRKASDSLLGTHFPNMDAGRVEFLPVRWHSALHSDATGINNQLKRVTLRSIPKLRSYTNETLTDILFYTSPKYCQHIVDTVASSICSQRRLFLQRNPDFRGDFSVAGHSLGSVIVFDLLSHQRKTPTITSSGESTEEDEDDDWSLVDGSATAATTANLNSQLASQLAIAANLSSGQLKQVLKVIGGTTGAPMSQSAGVGMPVINYPQLGFVINTCFLLGSPLSIFLTARGIDRLSSDFKLPSCSACVNIFHPFDPVAYRLETMIAPDYRHCAVLMPHHKGRKRIHLELKDNIARVGADISQRVYQSLRSTWRTLREFASAHTSAAIPAVTDTQEEEEQEESDAIKRVLSRLADGASDRPRRPVDGSGNYEKEEEDYDDDDDEVASTSFSSQLNQGRRIDYVLQEGPLESLNDYLFALSSHAVYWDNLDCILFMLNQIFDNVSAAPLLPTTEATPGTATLTRNASTLHQQQHFAIAPAISTSASTPQFGGTHQLHQLQQQYRCPSETPAFNPSPAPSSASLHSQVISTTAAPPSAAFAEVSEFDPLTPTSNDQTRPPHLVSTSGHSSAWGEVVQMGSEQGQGRGQEALSGFVEIDLAPKIHHQQ